MRARESGNGSIRQEMGGSLHTGGRHPPHAALTRKGDSHVHAEGTRAHHRVQPTNAQGRINGRNVGQCPCVGRTCDEPLASTHPVSYTHLRAHETDSYL